MSMDVNGCQWHRLFNFLSTRWLIKPKSPQPWAVLVLNRWHGAAHLEDLLFGGRQMSKNACSSTVEPMALKKTHSIHSCVSKWGTLNSSRVSLFHALQFANTTCPSALKTLLYCRNEATIFGRHHLPSQDGICCIFGSPNLKFQKFDTPKASWKGLIASGLSATAFGAAWATLPAVNCTQQTPRHLLKQYLQGNHWFFPPKKKNAVTKSLVQRAPCSTSQEFADAGSDLRVLETWPFTASTLMENSLWYPKFHWWKTRVA